MPPMDGRPPLAVSPRRLRPRRTLRAVSSDLTPPAYAKTRTPVRSSLPCDRLPTISSELIKMAKDVEEEEEDFEEEIAANLGVGGGGDGGGTVTKESSCGSPLFERGRFYELYSARRNERLRRKQVLMDESVVAHDPCVAVELAKKRYAKKSESVRKSVPASFSVSRAGSLRSSSSVRSSKEMKKGGSVAGGVYQKPTAAAAIAATRMGTRSVRRI